MKARFALLLVVSVCHGVLLADTVAPAGKYSAHEWGTFTSIQGSDGVPIAWNPFVKSDLPGFVYSRRHPFPDAVLAKHRRGFELMELKNSGAWLQRMETPVIYFHAEQPMTVRVRVEFPEGILSEWYPRAGSFGPVFGVDPVLAESGESFLEWTAVTLSPAGVRPADGTSDRARPPGDSHYYAARNARADDVRIEADSKGPSESESFLFYRGAGNFGAPLRVAMPSPEVVVLLNTGHQALKGLRIYERRGSQARQVSVPALAPGESRKVAWPGVGRDSEGAEAARALGEGLQRDLTEAGLNSDEAAAMIETWRESWLGEDGLRVLYLLPREWTDVVLPLRMDPPPRELVRVLVGRAEIFTAAEERISRSSFARFRTTLDARDLIPGFGGVNARFREPLLSRVGTIEERWAMTTDLFRCSLPNPKDATGHRLPEDLVAARVALGSLEARPTPRTEPGVAPRIPSDIVSGTLQSAEVRSWTSE